jgi:prepilin-type N-terminal cleavage/methylation domain-containing protein
MFVYRWTDICQWFQAGGSGCLKRFKSCCIQRAEATSDKGFTLLELIIVLVIAGIITSTLLSTFFTALKQGMRSEIYTTALYLVQQEIEKKRAVGYENAIIGSEETNVIIPEGGGRTYTVRVLTEYVEYSSDSFNIPDSPPTEYKRVTVTVSNTDISDVSMWTILAEDIYDPKPNPS